MNQINAEPQKKWILGIGGSTRDGVFLKKFTGTETELKQYMFQSILKERKFECSEYGDDYFDHGTESINEICDHDTQGTFYGYNCFSDSHTDYQAWPEELLEEEEELEL